MTRHQHHVWETQAYVRTGGPQDRHTPEALVPTATYLLDRVEGAHPLGTAVGQPVGDLAASH